MWFVFKLIILPNLLKHKFFKLPKRPTPGILGSL